MAKRSYQWAGNQEARELLEDQTFDRFRVWLLERADKQRDRVVSLAANQDLPCLRLEAGVLLGLEQVLTEITPVEDDE